MTFLKISALILIYFVSRAAMANSCELYTGIKTKEKICWNEKHNAYVSAVCQKKSCEALNFFESKKPKSKIEIKTRGGQNPSAMYCHHLKLPVMVLKDPRNYEQSFCQFSDGSLADAASISRD